VNKVRRPARQPVRPAVMFELLHAARQLEEQLESALATADLSMAKYRVLAQLAAYGKPMSLGQLAARHKCVRSNMTQLVDRLESDGLVRRVGDPEDRRSVRAELTPLGRTRQVAGAGAVERVQVEFSAALPARDRLALERALAALR